MTVAVIHVGFTNKITIVLPSPYSPAPGRVKKVRLSICGRLSSRFDIGNGWLELVGSGLEEDFKADYCFYAVAAQYIGLLS